ncbi:RagB/SusD family nutrient uptake outer membrane protein [Paraflavitalea speifideaquila]|uniref:RagB/SusD family nutrient uptake outer membrane protein n=1 Tax=Paraflavitalea speifideaquila TaxID=3076558 RepID=UPI0028EBC147|nr:RagB/SusD family nutrient uptake outer membrane protein [Paraflavitalea speifideiaquila]
MLYNENIRLVGIMIAIIGLISCSKNFLEQKPNTTLYVPETLEELRELLDNEKLINQHTYLDILSADEFYYTDTFASSLRTSERYAYSWSKQVFGEQETVADWDIPYQQVNYANQVLNKLQHITVTPLNQQLYNTVMGTALFIRSFAYFNLLQVFALPYEKNTMPNEWGIPLRMTEDVKERSKRATLQQSYEQIIQDLKTATALLPAGVMIYKNRPSAPAAWALLARTYLSMRFYEEAGAAADSSLRLYDSLLDFNQLDKQSESPFVSTNPEILYLSRIDTKVNSQLVGFASRGCFIDSGLLAAYSTGDLRRSIFFKAGIGGSIPKNSYVGERTFSLASQWMNYTSYVVNAMPGQAEQQQLFRTSIPYFGKGGKPVVLQH